MIDQIYQQIEFAKGKLEQASKEDNRDEMLQWGGYLQGLRYVLSLIASTSAQAIRRGEL